MDLLQIWYMYLSTLFSKQYTFHKDQTSSLDVPVVKSPKQYIFSQNRSVSLYPL